VLCCQVMAKAEAVELVRRGVRQLKDRAQLIVDNIEVNKSEVTSQLDSARPTCDQVGWALSTIDPGDVDRLCVDTRQPPQPLVARVMDCVMIVFQRPLNAVEIDDDRRCIKPSWNESAKVSDIWSTVGDSVSGVLQ